MEKTISLTSITAKFTKDFDTFGKMDPYLQVKCGQFAEKTQVANDQGKQPKWTKTFTFKITNQKEIQIIAYDQDVTENQLMGSAKIEIQSLKNAGNYDLPILEKDKKSIGNVAFKYQIKQTAIQVTPSTKIEQKQKAPLTNNLKEGTVANTLEKNINQNLSKKVIGSESVIKGKGDKRITLTNISGKFTKDFDIFGKMDVFLRFLLGVEKIQTEEAADMGKQPKWKATVNFQYTDQTAITVKAYDSDVTQEQFMGTGTINLKELKDTGKSQIPLLGEDKKSVGTIFFNYELKQLKPVAEIKKVESVQPMPIKKQEPKIQKKQEPKIQKKQELKIQKKQEPKIQKKQEPKIQKKVQEPPKEENKKIITEPSNLKPAKQIMIQKVQIAAIEKRPVIAQNNKGSQKDIQNSNVSKREEPNQTLNKSINSIRLPQIGDMSKNYGDKIFDKQSSATLQKSILVYSMPKAQRFGSGPKYCGQPSYYVDTCFKPNATKGVGFGFGAKRQFPEWMQKNMKENPAPGSYFQDSSKKGEYKQKGPTFGISYKYYQKVTIPKQKSPQKHAVSTKRLAPIVRTK